MSSISAGTTSTTGYVVTSDTTGALVLKTGASATTAVTIDTSQNVTLAVGSANGVTYLNGSKVLTSGSALTFNGTSLGVGSSSYGDAGSINLSIGVAGTTAGGLQLWASSAQEHYIQWGDSTTGSATYAGAISYSHASDFMRFWTSSAEQMRLTSTGLGIGTSSPAAKLDVRGIARVNEDNAGTKVIQLRSDWAGVDPAVQVVTNNPLLFVLNGTERARITAGGDFLLGTVLSGNQNWQFIGGASAQAKGRAVQPDTTQSYGYFDYYFGNTRSGYIIWDSTSLSLVSLSDYRKKENVVDLTGAIERLQQLKPRKFNFISDPDKTVDGFVAHELGEVIPQAVFGEKDAVDESGNPVYQAIDQSKIIPLLTAAIQEQQAIIESLKARLDAANL